MVEVESFVELGSRKDKFESSKPKEMGNGGGDHEKEGQVKNGNNDNGKNDGNGKPHNGKWNPTTNRKGQRNVSFMATAYSEELSKKSTLYVVEVDDELEKALMRLGSILITIEAKRVRKNEKKS